MILFETYFSHRESSFVKIYYPESVCLRLNNMFHNLNLATFFIEYASFHEVKTRLFYGRVEHFT